MSCVELANRVHAASPTEVRDLLSKIKPGESKGNWRKFGGLALRRVVEINGNVNVLKALMEHPKIDVNACDELGRTPLHLAVTRDAADLVEFLLTREDLDVNACALSDMTPLHLAARLGCSKVLNHFLKDRRVMLDARTIDEHTALHLVVEGEDAKSQLSKRRSLRERGEALVMLVRGLKERNMLAVLRDRDSVGRSALHYVAENGHTELLDTKMWNVTDIHAWDHCGFSPLHLAVRAGREVMVTMFLQVPSINAKIGTLKTSFYIHVNRMVNSCEEDPRKCQKLSLITLGKPPLETSHNLTPLHLAALEGNISIIGTLLNWRDSDGEGINVDACESKGLTALHYAAREGYVEVVQKLLSHQPRPHVNWLDTKSPIMYAVKRGHVEVVKELWKAVVSHQPEKLLNLTEELLKCATFHQSVASLLLKSLEGSGEIAKYLNSRRGQNLAHWVARTVASPSCLLTHILQWEPTYVNAKDENFERTPLHLAVINQNLEAVKALCLGNGQEVVQGNAKDVSGRHCLDFALHLQRSDIYDVLIRKPDVKSMVDRENNLRKSYVDASNAVLVGGALVATITYMGWQQPPLGYTTDYYLQEPFPAPPDTHPNYAFLKPATTWFFIFNGTSFFCSIGTVLVGLATVLPTTIVSAFLPQLQVARFLFDIACLFLIGAASSALAAFACAGVAVLPPESETKKSLVQGIFWGVAILWCFISNCYLSVVYEELNYWLTYFIRSKSHLHRGFFLLLVPLLGPLIPISCIVEPFDADS